MQKLLDSSLKIAGYGIYLADQYTENNYVQKGENYGKMFLQIMDAWLHLNVPNTYQNIFMSYGRYKDLIYSYKNTMIREQEMVCIEALLDEMISIHGKGNQQQNLDAFLELIKEKTISPSSPIGLIYTLDGSAFSTMEESDINWKFVKDMDGVKSYIGDLYTDTIINYPQLGLENNIMKGQTYFELESIIPTQYYREFSDDGKIIHLIPGQINEIEGEQIIPRTLMMKNQIKMQLSHDTFNVDYILHFTDENFNNKFPDAGCAIIIGAHGYYTAEYANTKVRKIKEIQDKGAPFISIINEARVKGRFDKAITDIRTDKTHPFYDPHFATVILNSEHFTLLQFIINNPETYTKGFESIIEDIAKKAYGVDIGYLNYKWLDVDACKYIAEAFGKSWDGTNIKTEPDMVKWWYNFENSFRRLYLSSDIVNPWFDIHSEIYKSHFDSIKKLYYQIDPNMDAPTWIVQMDLLKRWIS